MQANSEEAPNNTSAQPNTRLAIRFSTLLESFWFWWWLLLISCFVALYWTFVKHHPGAIMVVIGVSGEVTLEWKHTEKRLLRAFMALVVIGLGIELGETAEEDRETETIRSTNLVLKSNIEKLRSANLELLAKMQWRTIEPDKRKAIVASLRNAPKGQVDLVGHQADLEAMVFLQHIGGTLAEADFPLATNTWMAGGGGATGVIFIWRRNPAPPHADAIFRAYTNAGMPPPLLMTNDALIPDDRLRIWVGTKPPPSPQSVNP